MNRDQLVAEIGEAEVVRLEKGNCEPTSRCTPDGDDRIEYLSSIRLVNGDVAMAYYYQKPDALLDVDDDPIEDLGSLDWTVDRYELV
jgi:hypothetical protein